MRAKPARARRDKSPDDFELEKSKGHCTFRPNISRSSKSKLIGLENSSNQEIKGVGKLLERMSKARQEADMKKKFTERGITVANKKKGKESVTNFKLSLDETARSKYTSFGGQDGAQMKPAKAASSAV